jgi:tRNA nucleotidyltransferase (CCA-adding enzyme)
MAPFGTGKVQSSDSVLVETAEVTLSLKERQLRNLLLDVAQYIDESKKIQERLELRFAGGWVRDKLLRIPSHDIDTAINCMTGEAFSLWMKDYLKVPENLNKHNLTEKDVRAVHTIAANPEKSKHLETATTTIFGFGVDFVNLRKETYAMDSRNPLMEFGTAQEDALRRDATINALFYNIHTDKVEDFAGGLRDLRLRLIKTPLQPHQTFMDDPLRVLRLIRFASRLEFDIDANSRLSMMDPTIHNALKQKISRERVGIELEKMLKGEYQFCAMDTHANAIVEKEAGKPRKALQLIDELGLYNTIFTDPTAKNLPRPSSTQWSMAYNCLYSMCTDSFAQSIYDVLIHSPVQTHEDVRGNEAPYLAWILAALSPWANLTLPEIPQGKVPLPLGTGVAREGIKLPKGMCNVVTGAIRNRSEIHAMMTAVKDGELWIEQRDTLGMAIRRWGKHGHWKLQVLFAILVESLEIQSCNGNIS